MFWIKQMFYITVAFNNELSPDFDMTAQSTLHTLRYKIQIIKIGYNLI